MARADLSVGPPFGRTLRPEGSGELVVGGVERARHQLLAWYTGGVSQVIRLRGRWFETSAAYGAHWWSTCDRTQWCTYTTDPAQLHRALPARHELRNR